MSLILKSPIIKTFPVKLLHTWLKKGQSKLSLSRLLLGLRYTVQMVRLSVLSPLTDTMKYSLIREKIIDDENICNILKNSEILFVGFTVFDAGIKLGPHKDPNIYSEPYNRIQIPLEIPDKELCYMIWEGEKIHWTEGEPQVFEVMDVVHEGHNYSDKPMTFLFVDVKKDTIVEL